MHCTLLKAFSNIYTLSARGLEPKIQQQVFLCGNNSGAESATELFKPSKGSTSLQCKTNFLFLDFFVSAS